MAAVLVALCSMLVTLPATAGASAALRPAPAIQVLSNRADLISAGDVLVAVGLRRGARRVRVLVGNRKVTRLFKRRPDGRYEGLIERLHQGRNVLRVLADHTHEARQVVVNHPNGGPVLAGPQVKPWVCEDGARDSLCNKSTTYSYQYKSTSGSLSSYDPKNPPSDVATTKAQTGATVPFIVRTETGYQDRDQYEIAVLFQPGHSWRAWSPQKQFNHKLLITHGASCGIDHKSGTAPSVTGDTAGVPGVPGSSSSSLTALGLGFAVLSTALDNAGHNCNHTTMAKSLIMAKERLIERYGPLRYTIGTGCSGGSLAQQEVANSYPGVLPGDPPAVLLPRQLVDRAAARRLPPRSCLPRAPGEVGDGRDVDAEGDRRHGGSPEPRQRDHPRHALLDPAGRPGNACSGVTEAQRYDPQTNPRGARCTLADYMINVFGPRPKSVWSANEKKIGHGFAGRPIDNVGVQYGLNALKQGAISPAQFADLNAKIGGGDIDINPTTHRTAADRPALRRAYESGGINETNNLKDVAIIDLRGSDDGSFHDAYRAFAIRARLDRETTPTPTR